jgi:phage terminase large subunit
VSDLVLPASGWKPRPYQQPLWRYLERGGKRAVAAWHRRAGKDDLCLHWTACAAHERVAAYWHMLPEAAQARKAIWDAVNPHTGRKRIDEAFPERLRASTRNNEMSITFKNGSTWQVVGSDNYNSLVGSAPAGVVFSEWALADPAAWAYIRPILVENGGWALFISTSRGDNHFKAMTQEAIKDNGWFGEILSAKKTGVFSAEQLDREKIEYVRDYGAQDGLTRFRQEYLCDFDAPIVGSYYGADFSRLDDGKRIARVAWEPKVPVHTAWDLGIGDQTAIWMFQKVVDEIRVVDFIRNSGVHIGWYVNALRERPYTWGTDLLPHDAEPKRLQTGESIQETLRNLGRPNSKIVPMHNVYDGINAVRALLPRCWFDAEKCKDGLPALRQYKREWDDKRKVFKNHPLHDWCSDPADAFRYLAMGLSLIDDGGAWSKPLSYSNKGIV